MSALGPEDTLKLQVTNFGPIVEAEIDLRPLTVFIGPSNTGKSYLAILIYALHQIFSNNSSLALRSYHNTRSLDRGRRKLRSAISTQNIKKTLREISDSRESSGSDSINVPTTLLNQLAGIFDENIQFTIQQVYRCFGVDSADVLIRKGKTKNADISVRRYFSDNSNPFEYKMTLREKKSEVETAFPQSITIPVTSDLKSLLDDSISLIRSEKSISHQEDLFAYHYIGTLVDSILSQFLTPLHLPAYYLPADRTGIMHAHNVVVSALIGSAPRAGLRPATRTPMLSGVLADFLRELIDIDQLRYRKKKGKDDWGQMIEKNILFGSIRIDRTELVDYPHFKYRPSGWKSDLPLTNTSSMVSELAPVVLYLRHLIEPNNILIIEEPESHLHPAMQVELTRQLAILVNSGIRVIVTTHSEWLLEELANIVRRSEKPTFKQNKDDKGKIALRPEQVGTWLFQPKNRPKGSRISEIRIDDSGLFPSDYDEVATALHNEWAEITSEIECKS